MKTLMKWNVFIIQNLNKYLVTCLRENNSLLSFYNLVIVKAKQFNIFC